MAAPGDVIALAPAVALAEDLTTRERLKVEAQRLIAEFGVDGVSTRDIVKAAGQKNVASLHYYFGSKDGLYNAVLMQYYANLRGAEQNLHLEELPPLEALRRLVHFTVQDEPGERMRTVSRFITALFPKYRYVFEAAIGDQLNVTYQRCFTMIRERATGVAPDLLNTRLLFFALSVMELFAAREAAMEAGGSARAYWGGPTMIETIADAMTGMLLAPAAG